LGGIEVDIQVFFFAGKSRVGKRISRDSFKAVFSLSFLKCGA
jgi:hypothetical protein